MFLFDWLHCWRPCTWKTLKVAHVKGSVSVDPQMWIHPHSGFLLFVLLFSWQTISLLTATVYPLSFNSVREQYCVQCLAHFFQLIFLYSCFKCCYGVSGVSSVNLKNVSVMSPAAVHACVEVISFPFIEMAAGEDSLVCRLWQSIKYVLKEAPSISCM